MSRINTNRIPLQQPAPLPQQYNHRGGGVYGANQPNYQPNYGANQPSYQPNYGDNPPNYQPNYGANPPSYQPNYGTNQPSYEANEDNYWGNQPNYRNRWNNDRYRYYRNRSRSPYFNSGRRFHQRYYYNNNYRPQQRQRYNNNRSRYNNRYDNSDYRRPSPSNRRSRQSTTNNFISPSLRDVSPNGFELRSDLNLATTTGTPANALPQRQDFAATAANTTQPFIVYQNSRQQQQQTERQTITTSSYRRRQRRNQQQQQFGQNPRIGHNNNRFAVLAEEEDNIEANVDDNIEPLPVVINNNKKNKNKNETKKRGYLEHKRIFKWFDDDASLRETVKSRGNQKYILDSTPVYDEWVRTIYESEVWETYLKMGREQKHWAKEVVQRTKKRDDIENTRFIQKKIHQFTSKKAQLCATITDFQIQLGTYWSQVPTSKKSVPIRTESTITTTTPVETADINPSAATTAITNTNSMATRNENTNPEHIRNDIKKIENAIIDYIKHCTQHVKKSSQARTQLGKIQMDEFKALEDFQQSATPLHWQIHLTLKPKMKLWSIKDKSYRIAQKRVEYDLLPKFIANTNFTFKIDEALLSPEDAQATYNDMRRITSDFRTKAMTLYVQTAEREAELIKNEINELQKGFPKTTVEEEVSYDAFRQYHELRLKRLNLEAEQSFHFLDIQQVEGENNNHEEVDLPIAPTYVRELRKDISLQL